MTQFSIKSFTATKVYLPFSMIKHANTSLLDDVILNYEGCTYEMNDDGEIIIFSDDDRSLNEHVAKILVDKLKRVDEDDRNTRKGNY